MFPKNTSLGLKYQIYVLPSVCTCSCDFVLNNLAELYHASWPSCIMHMQVAIGSKFFQTTGANDV